MQPIRVKVKNFMSYKEQELDLASLRQVCVSGENGAGKSSMFVHSWMWALFGREHIDLDDVVGHFGNNTVVEADFKGPDGTVYTVRRERKKAIASNLVISTGGKAVATGAAEAQAFINREILRGCTYRDVIASVVMKQGEHSIFTRATPKEAKDILSRAVGEEGWTERCATAKTLKDRANNDLQQALGAVQRVPTIEQVDTDLIAREPEILREREEALGARVVAQERRDVAKAAMDTAETARKELDALVHDGNIRGQEHAAASLAHEEVKTRISELEIQVSRHDPDKLAGMEARLMVIEDARDKQQSWQQAHTPVQNEKYRFESRVMEVEQSLVALAEEYESVLNPTSSGVCHTCKRPFGDDAGALEAARSDYEERRSTFTDDLASHKKELKKAEKALKELGDEPEFDRAELETLRTAIGQARAAASVESDLRSMINVQEPALLSAKVAAAKALERARKDYEKAAKLADTGDFEKIYGEQQVAAQMVNDLDRKISSIDMSLGRIESLKKQQESAAANVERLQFDLEEAEYRAKVYTLAEKAFGRNGIPAYLIDAAIPAIERTANEILDRMSGGQLRVGLLTQVGNRDGTDRETLEIHIHDGVTTRKFSTYSGGQGFRINFALRVALARTIADRSGIGLSMLVIDEPEGLDGPGRQHLIDCISAIEDTFETVILISHHEDLRDALPGKITVTASDTNGSTLRMAG